MIEIAPMFALLKNSGNEIIIFRLRDAALAVFFSKRLFEPITHPLRPYSYSPAEFSCA
jgi:hypothetical protein